MIKPNRGEIWLADLGQPIGHEQRGIRPVLIVSDNALNHGATETVIALPLTTKIKNIPSQIIISPPEAGLKITSSIKSEAILAISHQRLNQCWGVVSISTMTKVEEALRFLFVL